VTESTLISERIRRALANDIASGTIPQGTTLDEKQVAARFDASRTPVREAIRMLAAEGLVEMRPRRGAIVSTISVQLITEMFELAAEIEAVCVRLATYRMNTSERARLDEIHLQTSEAVERGDVDAYAAANLAFHDAIYLATHNGFLAEQAANLRSRMAAFRRAQLFDAGRLARSRKEHEMIIEAMMKGDGEEASKRMRAHMFHAANAMQRHFSATEELAD